MKKIPTVFVPNYNEKGKRVGLSREFTSPETRQAFMTGTPTVKYDGACCAIIDGKFYKRFDAKKGKEPPKDAIPCGDPDPVTGHWPHWVPVTDSREDKWFRDAWDNTPADVRGENRLGCFTFEAVGKRFNANPYHLGFNMLVPHGEDRITENVPMDYDGIRDFLETFNGEGIVYWLGGRPVAKIKRTDFGFSWPLGEEVHHE